MSNSSPLVEANPQALVARALKQQALASRAGKQQSLASDSGPAEPPPGPTTPSPTFSEAYYRARKQYGLASGILIAWELIGLKTEKIPLDNINLSLKNPEAIPLVLVALVSYFCYRLSIEWYQTDSFRRKKQVSKVDFAVAHALAGLSIALFIIQRTSSIRIANVATSSAFSVFILSLSLPTLFLISYRVLRRDYYGPYGSWEKLIYISITLAAMTCTAAIVITSLESRPGLLAVAIGSLVGFWAANSLRGMLNKNAQVRVKKLPSRMWSEKGRINLMRESQAAEEMRKRASRGKGALRVVKRGALRVVKRVLEKLSKLS